ncbi:MAG: tRNA (adenosine(37)-N6)-dimethylallyltransferase MiaA [Synechococcaceae cyanobacterium SM2_3_1]|nr:tRNA (adenosine(37)-N6)-dimethylallyltransferase MiaA [Synechococcaceae cyanobacterium SM2_3_1]
MSAVPKLITFCGPTATGKSGQALYLAQRLESPLISADSRQIYRDFNIGTAKPTPAQQKAWPHELIDIVDPTETFTVAQYQAQAQALINKAHLQGQIPIVVGGTGLYIQALTEGLGIPAVPPQPQLRQQLEQLPPDLCYEFLQQVDPPAAARIHRNDRVRTLRALEIYYSTGRPSSQMKQRTPPPYEVLILGLTSSPSQLRRRIEQRARLMLAQGWIEEVKDLQAKYGLDLPLLQTLGYAEISRYLRGELSHDQLLLEIVQHTRQFAKRQLTWFRRTPGIEWLDCEADDLSHQIWSMVQDFLA